MPLGVDQFAKAVIAAGLSSPAEMKALWETIPAGQRPKNGDAFAKLLLEQGKLNDFQSSELLSGKTTPLVLGDYVLLDRIGAGGMGQVFKAQHRHMDRVVAIKLLSEALTKDEAAVQRFQREVKAAAKLSHPNIVHANDASVQRGVWYLVMEYVEGRDLASVVSEGPLPIAQALDYIRQAAKGLAFAHGRGIVHRDIKPANLLLDQEGTVKILDMGLARFEDRTAAQEGLTQSGQVMGTIDYMAPEQAFDTHTADARADIYSLGCTLYRLLTRQNMYEGETIVRKLMAHQTKPIPSLAAARPDAPVRLVKIFEKMVAKLPQERFQSMNELIAALNELDGKPAGASGVQSSGGGGSHVSGSGAQVATKGSAKVEVAATISLSHPQQSTDPVSERSIQIARDRSGMITNPLRLSWNQRPITWIASGLGTILLLFALLILFDPRGQRGGRLPIPPGGSATVISTAGWQGWPADAPRPAIAPFTEKEAKAYQKAWADYLNVPVEWQNSIGMKFVLIPPGEFLMGATEDDAKGNGQLPQQRVVLPEPTYIGVYEVTQASFQQIMDTNPSAYSPMGRAKDRVLGLDTTKHPVEMVSCDTAADFCVKLSQAENLKPSYFRANDIVTQLQGTGYRLPTESHWEFACRAGTITTYWSGDDEAALKKAGWYKENSGARTHEVGELEANPFGLFDVHGNVWEWVEDTWQPLTEEAQSKAAVAPIVPQPIVRQRVFRGGPYTDSAESLKTSTRNRSSSTLCNSALGFRVLLPVETVRQTMRRTVPTIPQSAATAIAAAGWHGWPADAPKPAIAPFTEAQAKAYQKAWAEYLKVPVEWENSIGMKFRLIPPGEFLMGSTPEEVLEAQKDVDPASPYATFLAECIKSESPQRKTVISTPFYLGIHEVSQADYKAVTKVNPSQFRNIANFDTTEFPVEQVTWDDAARFCVSLSTRELFLPNYSAAEGSLKTEKGTGYRLPTEIEWEFACRAGTTTTYWNGDSKSRIVDIGWCSVNSNGAPHSRGRLKGNPFRLFDMIGNVFEWVEDKWHQDDSRAIIRGGAWDNREASCRSASRTAPDSGRTFSIGFRVALPVDAVRKAKNLAGPAIPTSKPSVPNVVALAPIDFSAERKAAEWVLAAKGTLVLEDEAGKALPVESGQLPTGRFIVANVLLDANAGAKVTNSDLSNLAGCMRLRGLQVLNYSEINDHGFNVVPLREPLAVLHLGATQISDDTIVRAAEVTTLRDIDLRGTQVTDRGLAALAKNGRLTALYLGGVGTSVEAVQDIVAANPNLDLLSLNREPFEHVLENVAPHPNLRFVGCGPRQLTPAAVAFLNSCAKFERLWIVTDGESYPEGTFDRIGELKRLRRIHIGQMGIKEPVDARLIGKLVPLKTLFEIVMEAGCDDDCLIALKEISSLNSLSIFKDHHCTAEGINEFRKARPDVHLTIDDTEYPAVPAN